MTFHGSKWFCVESPSAVLARSCQPWSRMTVASSGCDPVAGCLQQHHMCLLPSFFPLITRLFILYSFNHYFMAPVCESASGDRVGDKMDTGSWRFWSHKETNREVAQAGWPCTETRMGMPQCPAECGSALQRLVLASCHMCVRVCVCKCMCVCVCMCMWVCCEHRLCNEINSVWNLTHSFLCLYWDLSYLIEHQFHHL